MCITYSVLSCKFAQAFRFFQFSSFQLQIINPDEFHVIFQDIEHDLRESFLHHFLHCSFL